jgi:hypothetical protein
MYVAKTIIGIRIGATSSTKRNPSAIVSARLRNSTISC